MKLRALLLQKKRKSNGNRRRCCRSCAAFIAQEKGHQVTLYEASDKLGGNMRLAAYPPGKGDITNMIRSYIVRCQKAGVTIKMNQEVTLDLIRKRNQTA